MQRFLTEARWSDETVLGPQAVQAVWVFEQRSAGRQYCGRLGKVANWFLAYVSPLGRALVDKRL